MEMLIVCGLWDKIADKPILKMLGVAAQQYARPMHPSGPPARISRAASIAPVRAPAPLATWDLPRVSSWIPASRSEMHSMSCNLGVELNESALKKFKAE
jgi:hypothetical protein